MRPESWFAYLRSIRSRTTDRCAFETLVRRVRLPDKRVRAIAEIVHDLDLKDSKYGRLETAGVRMVLDGIMAGTEYDEERIERALSLFDDVYDALGTRTNSRRRSFAGRRAALLRLTVFLAEVETFCLSGITSFRPG